jgi:hypothetical protein
MALLDLEQIRDDDTEREQAFNHVLAWLKERRPDDRMDTLVQHCRAAASLEDPRKARALLLCALGCLEAPERELASRRSDFEDQLLKFRAG